MHLFPVPQVIQQLSKHAIQLHTKHVHRVTDVQSAAPHGQWSSMATGSHVEASTFQLNTVEVSTRANNEQWEMTGLHVISKQKQFGARFPQVFSPLSKHAIQPNAKRMRPSHMVTGAPWQQNLMKTFYISRQFLSKRKSSLEQWDSSWLCVICWNLNITLYKVTVTDVPI